MQVTLFRKSIPASCSARSAKRLSPSILPLVSVFLFTFTAVLSQAQHTTTATAPDYTSIVVFGDSLSDTGNVAHLTQTKYGFRLPGPEFDYTDGRFTDGADTLPPAENYWGVWIEQLAASLPAKPAIKNSLNGGTDYAYGFAFTGTGTSVLAFGPSYSVNVNNIGLQIKDYLATHPKITSKTLFVVWGGANDILNATSEDQIIDAGINQALNIQALINAGATQFLIPNLPPLGAIPELNGLPTESAAATAASELYNEILGLTISILQEINYGNNVQLAQLNVFSLFDQIIASPSKFGLDNVTASSQGQDVDPDTYLFWDGLHPTTHGHNILATTAEKLLSSGGGGTATRPSRETDLAALRSKIFNKIATKPVLVVH